ncbi:type II toxin-antitoxin system RelE/ParE family toxin [Mucilaginibacter paludis]|uniref:Plasmid stabilization system n=1 Tax=Mucilaginibacter paludis DSM 18603 TaxID=714943 RepID=H1YFH8_9SPHI|nr:type II toxin-antitoxin system RelE/ParE family toxin [Mucilaginibacter paludis]EHQ27286.1 plasmid stabilization system [Mucilaginibacter paludis DSM 18603]
MAETQLLWSDRALNDYENLVAYLWSEWGEQITLRVINELEATITRIQHQPEHFPIVLKDKSIRRYVFSPQTSIFFRINSDTIEIISLFDNRQNPNQLKNL